MKIFQLTKIRVSNGGFRVFQHVGHITKVGIQIQVHHGVTVSYTNHRLIAIFFLYIA